MLKAKFMTSTIFTFQYWVYIFSSSFFFLRNFLVITFHWKAVHYYRLNNCWNLQGPFFLATLLIGWIGRFGGWAGDFFFFFATPKKIFWKTGFLCIFSWSIAQYFPPGFLFIICVLALIVSSSERLLLITLSNELSSNCTLSLYLLYSCNNF